MTVITSEALVSTFPPTLSSSNQFLIEFGLCLTTTTAHAQTSVASPNLDEIALVAYNCTLVVVPPWFEVSDLLAIVVLLADGVTVVVLATAGDVLVF